MKRFNLKEGSTWAGLGVMLMTLAGVLTSVGQPHLAAIATGIAGICGGVAGVIPDKSVPSIK